jgi:hypothetical protein
MHELRKAPVNFIMPIRLSVSPHVPVRLPLDRWISVKFDVGVVHENLSIKCMLG